MKRLIVPGSLLIAGACGGNVVVNWRRVLLSDTCISPAVVQRLPGVPSSHGAKPAQRSMTFWASIDASRELAACARGGMLRPFPSKEAA